MATDATALAGAIRAMREAVAGTNAAITAGKSFQAARINEIEAGRALLAALDGVPETIRAYELIVECLDGEMRQLVRQTLLATKTLEELEEERAE